MSKISEYPAQTTVIPTAQLYVFDPTAPTAPDKSLTQTLAANIPSVIKGFADQVTITIGAESANIRAITVQAKNADGTNLTQFAILRLIVFTTAAATALSTGGSTGVAQGANGMILNTEVAKLVFLVKTDAAGLWTGTYTDTGTVASFLGVQLPDGRLTMSTTMTNA